MSGDSRLVGAGAASSRRFFVGARCAAAACRPPALGPAVALAAVLAAGGCSPGANLPSPPTAAQASLQTAALPDPAKSEPVETATVVAGTPTDVYAAVAGGMLRCWLGAGGPLKASHVFHADAAPRSEGGAAEIVLHERDPSMRDQRGARAFRVALAAEGSGVRVGITTMRIAAPLAEVMERDVAAWAGGRKSCEARASSPPPPPQPPPKAMGARSGQR